MASRTDGATVRAEPSHFSCVDTSGPRLTRGLFITGFTIGEVLAIQARAKALLLEGKTIMNWNDAETSVSKQFTMPVADVLVLFSLATGNGVRGVVASVNAVAGTITLTANLGMALAPGDTVHLMVSSAQIPVGAATKDVNAPTVFVVNDGPGLVELDGTAACRINLVAGEYS